MSAPMRRLPLVIILGATGSGKSKLALEIGRLFNGEIISADSMQVSYTGSWGPLVLLLQHPDYRQTVASHMVSTTSSYEYAKQSILYLSIHSNLQYTTIYKGLDIITNKVTKEELQQCPHHMIDFLCPLQEHHTVVDYRDMAVPIIDRIFKSNKIPVIVGGTNYYIEALVWKILINKQDVEKATEQTKSLGSSSTDSKTLPALLQNNRESTGVKTDTAKQNVTSEDSDDSESDDEELIKFRQTLNNEDSHVLHQRLMEVDSKQGQRLHPNDKRKIIRALEVYNRHGIQMSDILKSQKSETGEESLRGPLRYNNTCIFWIQTNREVLEERTDKRVDKMLESGLVKELEDFHKQYNTSRIQENKEIDYEHGIFQSIGFKEFHEYLILPDEKKDTEKGKKCLLKGIERMKQVTRKYARKQVRWIENRFLKYRGSSLPPVYGLDSTDVTQWEDKVHNPAIQILSSVLKGDTPEQEPLPVDDSDNGFAYNVCDICGRVFTTEKDWKAHMTSKKHHKMVTAKRKREKNEELKRQSELRKTVKLLDNYKEQLSQEDVKSDEESELLDTSCLDTETNMSGDNVSNLEIPDTNVNKIPDTNTDVNNDTENSMTVGVISEKL